MSGIAAIRGPVKDKAAYKSFLRELGYPGAATGARDGGNHGH